MRMSGWLFIACTMTVMLAGANRSSAAAAPATRPVGPNIVLIYTDDVGYGDVGCYGATKVKTPHIDRLARTGLRFTDGHSTAATCTPSRYSLLTGRYAFRKKGAIILPGDAPLVIDADRPTLPSILRDAGYATGVVGKWHLGLGDGKADPAVGQKIDWNGDIKPGPKEVGFDYSYLIPATGDRVPTVYTENGRVVGLEPADPIRVSYDHKVGDEPTGKDHPELLKMKLTHGHDFTIVNGISRIGWMTGGKSAWWVDEDMADTITGKAVSFIERNRDKPFFLYFATHDIHVPRAPNERFKGTSGTGTRGDAIQQMDWSVGQVVDALDRLGLTDNTLLIFTSDNGPVLDDGYADGAVADLNGHDPAGGFRGGKYSLYEGGTRVPLIARWPARIKPGVSDQLISQVDFAASFAALAGAKVPAGAAPDSVNVLPALLGQANQPIRHYLVEQQGNPALALRQGDWKLIPAASDKRGAELYDLEKDPAETKNLAKEHPEKVTEMTALLDRIKSDGGDTGE